ncbi:hypothetical protein KKF59_01650 [Patescibacteria group bacterium]|nr:hypothetical protein [Patescibacteria group bacterium]MBU1034662.1 hypothetical protein [Patescibacteria group bacterium]MBU1629561.1 hypothetical protein [Patescibacteria group bacterium]MBU1907818.1 hypothetical protein [Patescibacteria group bacterium]
MIIICSGPDTFRARERARLLFDAFREKHDREGFSTENVGSSSLSDLLARFGAGSLFCSKKMVRVDGCLADLKIAEVRSLAAVLERDKENTVLLTVEEDPPNEKVLTALAAAPLHHFNFARQTGLAFRKWVREKAAPLGVAQASVDAIAEYADGDSWLAIQELGKLEANSVADASGWVRPESQTVFEVAEKMLRRDAGWRTKIEALKDEGSSAIFLSQARSYLRVKDHRADGIHPYVVKKMSGLRVVDGPDQFANLLKMFVASRSNLTNGREGEVLY